MLNVYKVEVKMKVEMEGEDSSAGVCFTIFVQQLSLATEYSILKVDLCEIPIHIQIRAIIQFNLCTGWLVVT